MTTKRYQDERLEPMIRSLKDLIREQDWTQASVERHLGLSDKYLYKVFQGYLKLKVGDVLDVLDALEVPHGDFWARLAQESAPSNSVVGMDLEELNRHIEGIVATVLSERAEREAAKDAPPPRGRS